MGTYTTNYNLYMPTIGEQGWGTLVNGNFTTIDTTMAGLNTRLTAVENEVNGALSCTSVTTSGKVTANGGVGTTSLTTSSTITSTGLITANGGVKGNLTGNVTGRVYVTATISTSKGNNDPTYATCAAQSASKSTTTATGTYVNSNTLTIAGYSVISMSYPYKLYPGIYIQSSSAVSGSVPSSVSRTVTLTLKCTSPSTSNGNAVARLYVNGSMVKEIYNRPTDYGVLATATYTVNKGNTVYCAVCSNGYATVEGSVSISALSTYYLNTN